MVIHGICHFCTKTAVIGDFLLVNSLFTPSCGKIVSRLFPNVDHYFATPTIVMTERPCSECERRTESESAVLSVNETEQQSGTVLRATTSKSEGKSLDQARC